MPSWRSMSAMSARVTVPVLERSRIEKASRMGRRYCGARRERGSEGREGFVFGGIIDVDVDVAGVGAVGRGLLLRLFPVLSDATGVIAVSVLLL